MQVSPKGPGTHAKLPIFFVAHQKHKISPTMSVSFLQSERCLPSTTFCKNIGKKIKHSALHLQEWFVRLAIPSKHYGNALEVHWFPWTWWYRLLLSQINGSFDFKICTLSLQHNFSVCKLRGCYLSVTQLAKETLCMSEQCVPSASFHLFKSLARL